MRFKAALWITVWSSVCLWTFVPVGTAYLTAAADSKTGLSQDEKNRKIFTDLTVMTHEGKPLRFYSDILKDKVVVICFFYINCPTPQPALVTLFKLQKRLGPRLGQDVVLLTISVDPANDSVEAIREYARKYNPQNGWLFLTGQEENMNVINRKFGNRYRLPEGHLRQFVIGNVNAGQWMRMPETAHVVAVYQGLQKLSAEQ